MKESRLFKIVYHLINKGHATAPNWLILSNNITEEKT